MRPIDADALMERFAEMQKVKPDKDGREYACNFRNMGGEPSVEWFVVEDAVENAPTVDAVPVRCRDCKWFKSGIDIDGKPFTKCIGAVRTYGHTAPDWFCADGERRGDGEQ